MNNDAKRSYSTQVERYVAEYNRMIGPARPIRVMHVVNVLGLAGMEHGVIKLVNRLDSAQFTPMICCLSFQRDSTRPLLNERITVVELHRRSGRDLQTILSLATQLRQEKVDIVHSHNWQTFLYAAAATLLTQSAVLIHGEHGREGQSATPRQIFLSRYLAKLAVRVTTVSAELGKELVTRWKIPSELVSDIPNGVDLDIFGQSESVDSLRREFNFSPENQVILNIGGLRPVKDHPTLLRAFAQVSQKFPHVRLVLVGTDSGKGIRSQLETQVDQLGIRHAVHFAGSRYDIPQLLALCDVYVNSSRFEGMSNTILEAMASHRPVIATDVGGNPELVVPELTGALFSPGDDRTLAHLMGRLLQDPALVRKMGQEGRAKVERDHSITKMVQAYSTLYRGVFARKEASRHYSRQEWTKQWLARGLFWSGANYVKRHVSRPALTILVYHRVLPVDESQRSPFQGMVMAKDIFEAQMAHLQRYTSVLTLTDALQLLREDRLPHRPVVVTFDDGYRDNYEHAWPILAKYQIPATFFLTTDAIDRQVALWWDEVGMCVEHLSQKFCTERLQSLTEIPTWLASLLRQLSEERTAQEITVAIVNHLNRDSSQERRHILRLLRTIARFDDTEGAGMMLTWDNLRMMVKSGMQVGSHTVTHAFLDELDEAGARVEIEGSIQRIGQELRTPVRHFAYPRGRMVGSARKILRDVGIEAAVTTNPGHNGPQADLLQLKRFDAGYAQSRKGFDAAIFDAELHGWFTPFRSH